MFQDGVKKTILSASFIPAVGYSRDKEPWPASATALCPQANREIWQTGHWFPSLTFQQFQVLFNSLFKVLCIFPSWYLCTIGLPPIFSFRWNLPPTLSCNPKQLDSLRVPTQIEDPRHERECHPLCCPIPRDLSLGHNWWHFYRPQFGTQKMVQIRHELFPLHSPLLGESLLVYFPPLINMLKFGG